MKTHVNDKNFFIITKDHCYSFKTSGFQYLTTNKPYSILINATRKIFFANHVIGLKTYKEQ